MAITFHSENADFPAKFDTRRIAEWLRRVASSEGRRTGAINYVFCDDTTVLRVNRHFLAHDYYTDVITFDYSQGDTAAGDVYISLETVGSNAAELGVTFEEELRRVVVHALLHLCAQDDKTPEDAALMREKENRALAEFSSGIKITKLKLI